MSEQLTPFAHPWTEDIVGNVATVTVGGTPSTAVSSYWNGDVPWMASGDVHLKKVIDVPQRISELGLRHSAATLVDPPSVAVALAGQGKTRGTAALVLCRLCTNQSVALISPRSDDVLTEYLFFNLQFRYDELRSRSAGGGRAGLTKRLIEQIPLPLPPRAEQEKIAEILSAVERAVEETEAVVAKLQRVARGMMMDLFTRGIDDDGRLRSETSHKFKDSIWGKIPAEWDVVETRHVCSLITKGTTPKVRSTESPRFCVPYLRVENLTFSGELDLSDLAFIDNTTQRGELARSRVVPGDVLQNIVGPPLGKVATVPDDYPEWNINQAIALFRPNARVLGGFLSYWLRCPATRTWFDINSKKTSGQQNLTLEHCQKIPILLPPLDEQTRICSTLNAVANSQEGRLRQVHKLRLLKTALMQDLLTGRKRVTPLLEVSCRIAAQSS